MAKSKKQEGAEDEVIVQPVVSEEVQEEKVEETKQEEVHPHKVGLQSRDYRSKYGK